MKCGYKEVHTATVTGELILDEMVVKDDEGEQIKTINELLQEFDGQLITITIKKVKE